MKSGPPLVLQAPAKINIFLKILAKRSDDYHELVSWMHKLTLYDTLTMQAKSSGIYLRCPGSNIPENSENLAYKAAHIFFESNGINGGVDIVLEKQIPVAAGLGGGSSDAASVLKGLNLLYNTKCTTEQLMDMASQLGADVPFFVFEYPSAWATGIGERLRKNKPMPECWIVLVNPGFSVSTKWVYDNLALTSEANPDTFTRFTEFVKLSSNKNEDVSASEHLQECRDGIMDSIHCYSSQVLSNDLEQVTSNKYPEITVIKEKLLQENASGVLMSGSGPTVFGVFKNRQDALNCRNHLEPDYPDNVFLVKPIRS
jgi:4-diphosphocytidyl-2-C-methyl-D-erythritol kinase